MNSLQEFDILHSSERSCFVIGVDEVGRGCIAGPVVACACLLDVNSVLCDGIADSKLLSSSVREYIFENVADKCLFTFGFADRKEIDSLNILQASLLAMTRALSFLGHVEGTVLIDGTFSPQIPSNISAIDLFSIVKGDSKSRAIALSSILAKVKRDSLMQDFDKLYPEYRFAKHKGYPTSAHLEAIDKFGIVDIHRRSFSPVKNYLHKKAKEHA